MNVQYIKVPETYLCKVRKICLIVFSKVHFTFKYFPKLKIIRLVTSMLVFRQYDCKTTVSTIYT